MATRLAAGQEKHAFSLVTAQKMTWLMQCFAAPDSLRKMRKGAICRAMCFHATTSGAILPVWSKTAYDEVMLHCARIGFKP
jgi:hypothetical protein